MIEDDIPTRRENARMFKAYRSSPVYAEMSLRHPRRTLRSHWTWERWRHGFGSRGDWCFELPPFAFAWTLVDRFQTKYPWFLKPDSEWPHAIGSGDEDLAMWAEFYAMSNDR